MDQNGACCGPDFSWGRDVVRGDLLGQAGGAEIPEVFLGERIRSGRPIFLPLSPLAALTPSSPKVLRWTSKLLPDDREPNPPLPYRASLIDVSRKYLLV